ncbi:hypothetical protein HJC23_004313 [Cyclotella cryptica]|uniref:Uncharacterized protein n=1 Tax=Cyclotella cryptica TaxID=29204 RepID=A0ABD3Q4I0_9STRA
MDSSSDPPSPQQPSPPPSNTDGDNATSSATTQSPPPHHAQTPPPNHNDVPTLRHRLGTHLSDLSDLINSNLILFRYGAVSSILLLSVYGMANTPLFYRYKSVWDIPAKMWKRRWIHGRIVGVQTGRGEAMNGGGRASSGISSLLSSSVLRQRNYSLEYENNHSSTNQTITKTNEAHCPIIVFVRHSSPMERLLTQKAMDKLLSLTGNSNHSSSNTSHTQRRRNLIPIELAGILHPPPTTTTLGDMSHHHGMGLLHKLVHDKTRVSIQLLAQRATVASLSDVSPEEGRARIPLSDDGQSTAIGHVTYRKPKQWFHRSNVSLELVAAGQALLSSSVVPQSLETRDDVDATTTITTITNTVLHFDPTPRHLQEDAAFLSLLEQAEYTAWKAKVGVWSSEKMRDLRMEYRVEEEYVSSRWSTRVWNALRRGWGWIRQ